MTKDQSRYEQIAFVAKDLRMQLLERRGYVNEKGAVTEKGLQALTRLCAN